MSRPSKHRTRRDNHAQSINQLINHQLTNLKPLFDFYINSSIHVALGVVSLTAITGLHFGLEVEPELLWFVFFGTITGYNFVKYAGIAKLHHRSLARNLKQLQIFSLLSFIVLCYLLFRISVEVLIVAGFLGLFTALYALPIFGKQRNLRSIGGIKIYVIAVIWAGVSVLFPLVAAEHFIGMGALLELAQRFLFVLILIIPFEIRDLKYDTEELRTLPQKYGVRKTKFLGYALIVMWLVLELVKPTSTLASVLAILFAAIFTSYAIHKANEDQPKYFSSFWVEGIPVLWFLLLFLLERLPITP